MHETDLRRALDERFGHRAFRPGQEDVVLAVLRGDDVVAVSLAEATAKVMMASSYQWRHQK